MRTVARSVLTVEGHVVDALGFSLWLPPSGTHVTGIGDHTSVTLLCTQNETIGPRCQGCDAAELGDIWVAGPQQLHRSPLLGGLVETLLEKIPIDLVASSIGWGVGTRKGKG